MMNFLKMIANAIAVSNVYYADVYAAKNAARYLN